MPENENKNTEPKVEDTENKKDQETKEVTEPKAAVAKPVEEKAEKVEGKPEKIEDKIDEGKADETKADADKKDNTDSDAKAKEGDEDKVADGSESKDDDIISSTKRGLWVGGIVIIAALVVAGIIWASTSLTGTANKSNAAATVNGVAISLTVFDAQVAQYEESMNSYDESEREERMLELKQLILDQLINQELALQMVTDAGITVSDEDVEESYQTVIESVGGAEAAEEILAAQGMTPADYKEQIRLQMMVQEYIQQNFDDLTVTEEEIKQEFEQNKDLYVDESGEALPLEDVSAEIEDTLLTNKQNDAFTERLEEFLKKADVEVFVDGLKVPTSISTGEEAA